MNELKEPRNASTCYALVFANALPVIKEIANKHGYCAAVHGSMTADLDILMAPWVENASDPDVVMKELSVRFGGEYGHISLIRGPDVKPHGRIAYTTMFFITPTEPGMNSPPYLDVSFMPRILTKL